ncbi:MAG: radical SAM family heme chaperone HemW [Bryobacteraceae bacterium]|nr:radical SAM family heme chaperone HemW [Bryobacteraceae bacterium]
MSGVYISYPFCAQKCTYCNFASGVFPRALEEDYLEALEQEISSWSWEWTPETVYIGGGTPSRMKPETLERILGKIPGRPWKEATIEAAPGGITAELASAWRESGITRVSLGVQSFVRTEIARTGRKHSAEQVALELDLLASAGIRNVNIDLIAGLSGQTPESWDESLRWIERLRPAHVSVYMLEIDEDSRLGQEILLNGERYGAPDVPSEERTAEFYETAVERLHRIGIERYEISNFAVPGFESRHNLKYWRLEPYVGFGADAHSFDGGLRWQNVETVKEYVGRWRRGEPVRGEASPADETGERFFVGLRLMAGIRPRPEERLRFDVPIKRFLDEGLLEEEDGVLRLTSRGVLLSNEVFQEFVTV